MERPRTFDIQRFLTNSLSDCAPVRSRTVRKCASPRKSLSVGFAQCANTRVAVVRFERESFGAPHQMLASLDERGSARLAGRLDQLFLPPNPSFVSKFGNQLGGSRSRDSTP